MDEQKVEVLFERFKDDKGLLLIFTSNNGKVWYMTNEAREKANQKIFGLELCDIYHAALLNRIVQIEAQLSGAKRLLASHGCYLNAEGNWIYESTKKEKTEETVP